MNFEKLNGELILAKRFHDLDLVEKESDVL